MEKDSKSAKIDQTIRQLLQQSCTRLTCRMMYNKFGAMHFIYYISRSIATKVDSTYLGD